MDLLRSPSGAAGEHLLDLSALSDDLVCGDDEIGNRAACTVGVRLSQHGAGVSEHGPLAGISGGQSTAVSAAACPTQVVATGAPMWCIASKIAVIAVRDPPGVDVHVIGRSRLLESRWSSER